MTIKNWWPAASNPTVEVHSAADFFPDVNLAGNHLFLFLYFGIGLVLMSSGKNFIIEAICCHA